jgi:hypothetical protein
MKIINQTNDRMVLKEGGASGIALGLIFVVAGAVIGYYLRTSSPAVIWIALALIVIGLGMTLFSSSITVDASKATGQLLYQKKRLIGGSSATYAISDVLHIETRKQWRMENTGAAGGRNVAMPQQVLVSQSVIVFKDGRELPLDHQKNSSSVSVGSVMMTGQGTEVAIATQVANFLGVPFQEIAPPNSGTGINIGGGPGSIQL